MTGGHTESRARRTKMRLLAVFSLAAASLWPQPPVSSLTGRWRSTAVSSSGVSAIFEFGAENRVDSYSAVILEQNYRLAGTDTIILQSPTSREKKLELEWENPDRAHIDYEPGGTSIPLARANRMPDPRNPILGEWTTQRDWNGRKYPARAIFSAAGRVTWVIQLRSEHGRYTVRDRNLRLEIENRPAVEGEFTVAGEHLTLPGPQGGQMIFERF